jgi:predicted ATP-grasp superfamily ATP-dependent carboligase
MRVLIVGVSTRAMAESAARAGHVVSSIDAFGDLDQHDGVRALSMPRDFGVAFTASAVADAAGTIDCDAVAYLSPFENHASVVERLGRGRVLLGNPPSVLARARDPRRLALALGSSADRWLLKPLASGGGHGIREWTLGDPVPAGWYQQPFIEGTAGSIVFVAAGGASVPLGLTRQLVGDPAFGATGFRYCGSIIAPVSFRAKRGIAVLPVESVVIPSEARNGDRPGSGGGLLDSAASLASRFARELDLVGVNCIDFIAHGDTALPIEINPRWSASMELVERAYGINVFAAHAAACTSGDLPAFDLRTTAARAPTLGKAILFARHDVTCGDTRAWLDDATIRDVPHPGEQIRAGRPVCTIFASGRDEPSCYATLTEKAAAVYDQLETWSSVIA